MSFEMDNDVFSVTIYLADWLSSTVYLM